MHGALGVVGAWASGNYFHWLFDVLPRFHLLERAGLPLNSIIVANRKAFQRQTLALMRLSPNLMPLTAETHLLADELVVPALAVRPRAFPIWACKFLRETFLPAATIPPDVGKRIYISRRKGGRVMLKEAGLRALLEDAGFSIIRPELLSFSQQVGAFANAEVIVAPHGAGLANTVFCKPGTQVVEVFDPSYVVVDYWSLANEVGLPYRYVIAEKQRGRGGGRFADITVDPAVLMSAVRDATREVEVVASEASGASAYASHRPE
ncbi:MAG: glycosyltransferase family 61 protein [Chloroflexota bacterium]